MTDTQHPLVVRILQLRTEIKSLRRELRDRPRARGAADRREQLGRRSTHLSGMEEAATLALGADDMAVLLADLRRG